MLLLANKFVEHLATDTGNDDGYAVPLQLHPHTEDLAALLLPGGLLGCWWDLLCRRHLARSAGGITLLTRTSEAAVDSIM